MRPIAIDGIVAIYLESLFKDLIDVVGYILLKKCMLTYDLICQSKIDEIV